MKPMVAFYFDTTFGQIAADILLIVLVAVNMWAGWRFGLVRRAITFAGIYAGVLAASYLGNPVASLLGVSDRLSANAWSFVGLFAIVTVMIEVMGALYSDRLQSMLVVTFDRIAGLIGGLLVGVFQTGVLFAVAIAAGNAPPPSIDNTIPSNYTSAKSAAQTAMLGEYVADLNEGTLALFGPALPKDLTAHLVEGTQVTQTH